MMLTQHMMLTEHQELGNQMRKYGEDEWLKLLNHCQQVPIHEKNLVVSLGYKYLKNLIKLVKRSLLHLFHESTHLVISRTTQIKTSVTGL